MNQSSPLISDLPIVCAAVRDSLEQHKAGYIFRGAIPESLAAFPDDEGRQSIFVTLYLRALPYSISVDPVTNALLEDLAHPFDC